MGTVIATAHAKGPNMKAIVFCLFGLAIALTGCLPQTATPVDLDAQVATSVSETLTAEAPLPTASLPTEPPPASDTPPPPPTEVPTLAPPTEAPSPTTTTSSTITATSVSGDPVPALGQATWRDTFESGGGWNLGEDSFTEAKVEDGNFVLTGFTTADGWRLTWPEVEDVYLEASIRTKTCESSDEYGLMLRVPDVHEADRGYLFGFTCDGRYFLRLWDGEDMNTLIGSTAIAAIQAGSDKTNRIGVWSEGDDLTLYANGTLLVRITDETLPVKGGFGYFIGARKTPEFTVESSEIAYWNLP
jgi:hypothetical protein